MKPELGPIEPAFPEEEETSLQETLRKALRIYRRRAPLFWIGFLCVVAGSILYLLTLTPRYTASATVVLDPRRQDVVNMQAVLSGMPTDSAAIDTEVGIIRSDVLVRKVVKDLDLEDDPEFNPALKSPSLVGDLLHQVKSLFGGITTAAAKPTQADPLASSGGNNSPAIETAAGILKSRLNVHRDGLTYLISIGVSSEQPKKAAKIANRYAELYLDHQLEAKYDATKRANDWLSGRVKALKGQVETAEAAVENYRAQHGLLSADGNTLIENQIVSLSGQVNDAQAKLASASARLDNVTSKLRSGHSIDSVGDVLTSPAIQQLRAQYSTVARKKAQLATTLGPRHPEILQINQELADLDSQIQAAINRIVGNLENEVSVDRQHVKALEASLAKAQKQLARTDSASVQLHQLQRDADASKTLYESFLSRFKQTTEQQSLAQPDAEIISRATPPEAPSYPRPKQVLTMSVAGGALFGFALVWLAEALDAGFRLPEDIERETGLPALGVVPLLNDEDLSVNGKKVAPEDFVFEKPFTAFTEAFRALKASLILSNVDRKPKTILITSAAPGEGKTLTTIAFGRTLALAGSKVILVDTDLRRAGLTHALRIQPEAGLVECIAGEAELKDVIVTEPGNVSVLPLSKALHTPVDLFSSEAFQRILAELRARYDLVLLDSPPVHAVADTLILSQRTDTVLVLARWSKTPRHLVQDTLKDLQRANAHIAGVALSQVDRKVQGREAYGYGYGYNGYSAYSKYYQE